MLLPRVLTALALLLVLVPTVILASATQFALLCLAILLGCLWEWSGLLGLRLGPRVAAQFVLSLGLLPLILDFQVSPQLLAESVLLPAVLLWLAGLPLALGRVRTPQGLLGLLLAVSACLAAFVALWLARVEGLGYLLSVLLLVWIADTAAYFAGRAFGQRKLAPAISPGKTWAGAWGAVLGNLVYVSLAASQWPGSWPAEMMGHGYAMLLLATGLITVVSIEADLHQSLLKRQVGVKDSGHLLPGHGGLFDRLDALLAVLPLALFFALL